MAVSLSEITAIKGSPLIGAGTAGSVANLAQLPADQFALQILDSAAGARMLANKYAQDLFQQNLKEYYNNFNSIDVNGLMEKDYDVIVPQWAQLAKDMADNYDVIGNPMKDQQRYADLKQREARLRGQIAQSKQDVGLRQIYGNFISQHKDFETPENISKLQRFTQAPMGQRDYNDITTVMPKWDVMQQEISAIANSSALRKTKEEDTAKPFTTTTDLTQYYKGAYDDAVRSLVRGQDLYGRQLLGASQATLDFQPEQVRNQYRNPDGTYRLEDYAVDQVYGPLRNQDQVAITRQINPLAEIAAQGAQQRATLAYKKKLDDSELDTVATEIPVRQLAVFGLPDKSQSPRENVVVKSQSTGNEVADKAINQFASFFGVGGMAPSQNVQGVPVTLDTWLTNAYSIPSGKRKVIDPDTRKETFEDNYLRPEKAWITTEADPNARKVVVRYVTNEDNGTTKDLVIPYAENLQLLNNVAGQSNAVKLGGAKARLLKEYTGRVSPSYQQLQSVDLFRNPNTGGTGLLLEESAPPGTPGAAQIPVNPTTGALLNATQYRKQLQGKPR